MSRRCAPCMGGRSEYMHIHIYDYGYVYNTYEIYLDSPLIAARIV